MDKDTAISKSKDLTEEITGVSGFVDRVGSMPNPDIILRKAGIAIDTYEEMLQDPQIFASYDKRKRKVLKFKYRVESEDKTLSEELSKILTNLDVSKIVRGLLKALPYGYAVSEIIWDIEEGKYIPKAIKNRSSAKFTFNEYGELLYATEAGNELAPYGKFIVFTNDSDDDNNPYGNSLNAKCYWYWRFKKHGWKTWGLFLEKYGDPALIAYTNEPNEEKRRKILSDLNNVSSGSNMVIGKDAEIKPIAVPSSGNIGYSEYVKQADLQIAKIYLGSTMLIDDTTHGTYNVAQQHGDDFYDMVFADATAIAKAITKYLIEPYIKFNYGDTKEVPQLVMYDEVRDEATQGEVEDETKEEVDEQKEQKNESKTETKTGDEKTEKKSVKSETKESFKTSRGNDNTTDLSNIPIDEYELEGATKHKIQLEQLFLDLSKKHKRSLKKLFKLDSYPKDPKEFIKELGNFSNKLQDSLAEDYSKAVFFTMLLAKYYAKNPNKNKQYTLIDSIRELFVKDLDVKVLDFKEARKLFKNKVPLTDIEYKSLTNEAKALGFSFAGAYSRDVSKYLYDLLLDEIKNNKGEKGFKKRVEDSLYKKFGVKPFNKAHYANIYRTNLFSVYSQANYKEYLNVKKQFPYLMYDSVGDGRTRPTHRAMDGLIFRADDKFWETHYPPNGYNCYSDDTEVFTNNGWKLFKDVDIKKDLFLSVNPNNGEVAYKKAINKIEQYRDEELLHFKSNTLDCLVTQDHNMLVITDWQIKNNREMKLIEAKGVNKTNYLTRNPILYNGKDVEYIELFSIKFEPKRFCYFLGVYLADGSTSKRGDYYDSKIAQIQGEKRKKIEDRLYGFEITLSSRKEAIGINGNKDFKKFLYSLGKTKSKYIPNFIKELSTEYLNCIIDGFLDTDGVTGKQHIHSISGNLANGSKQIFTTSDKLLNDLTEIALKIGYAPSYYTNNNGCHIITLTTKKYAIAGTPKKVKYKGFVRCVELEEWHTLYVRRNGKALFSGNCRCSVIPLSKADVKPSDVKDGKDYIDDPRYAPDKGWDYHSGKGGLKPFDNIEFYGEPLKGSYYKSSKDYGLPTIPTVGEKRDYSIDKNNILSKDLELYTKDGIKVRAYKELNLPFGDRVILDVVSNADEVYLYLTAKGFETIYYKTIEDKEGRLWHILVVVDRYGQVREVKEFKKDRFGILIYKKDT